MKYKVPVILVVCSLVTAALSFVADDSFGRLSTLRHTVDEQRQANEVLADTVGVLRREVQGLQRDPRTLERAARSELGMARPNEIVVVFDKKS